MPFVPGDGGSFRPARARESYAGGLRDEGASNYFQRVRTAELDAHASVLAATKQDPDSAAKARRLSSYTGIPVDTVMRNLPDLEATLRGEAASDAMRKDPAILRWMADPWRAASSHDDLPAMGEASRALAEAKPSSLFDVTATKERYSRADAAWRAAQFEFAKRGQAALPGLQAAQREMSLAAGARNKAESSFAADNAGGTWDRLGAMWGQGVDSLFGGLDEALGGTLPSIGIHSVTSREGGASLAQTKEASLNLQAALNAPRVKGGTTWEDVKARPLSGNVFSFVAETGAQSLPGMGAAITAAPVYALSLTGQVGNRRAQNNGRDHATAGDLLAAAPAAVASAWLEKIGAMSIFRPVGATALKKIGYGALAETATEAVQSSVEYAGGSVGTDRGFSTLEMLDQAAAGALAGAGMGGIFTSAHVIPRKAIESGVRVMQARIGRRIVDQVFTAAANSETRRRDPALFAEFLAQAANGTAVENLFIPAEKIRELYQSNGWDWNADEDPLFGSFTPDFREQMEAGLASGGDVVVPLAQAAAHLAGTPEWDALQGDVRPSPGAFSDSEAAAMEADWAAHMEDLGQRAAKEARDEADAAAPREKVFSAVLSFARQSGFSLGASRAYADLWAERYQTRAERLGGDANAFDLLQSSLAGIQQDLPGSVKGYRKGDGLDVLINAMRNSAQPMAPQGKTLIDRIIEGGGIIDTGGDVAKMGGDKVAKGDGLFGRRKQPLIRQRDDTGETLGMGSNADYGADEWALRLWEEGYFPDLQDRPDVNTLLDAIGEGLSGNHRYAAGAVTAAVETNNSIVQAADDLRNVLFNAGLDPETASREEIEKAIRNYQNEDGRGFEQAVFQGGARGRIDFLADNRAMITLFEGRDMSTLLHEGGHLWLEELRADALASLDAKPVTLFHGSPRADLTVADIQIVGGPKRKQGKAGSSYGGFYASDVNSTSDAEGYAGEGGTVYRIELRPGATIETKEGDITRLSEETIADYRARGVDVVKGTDPRGRTEYAIINEGAIASMVDRNTPPEKRGSKVYSDWETIKARFKREGIEVDDHGDIPTEAHELWARWIERYFMEGKAPSRVLEGAFGKFRAWLLRIYQLVDRLGPNIDNDVRRVFDRMIATDNAIAWAAHEADERALFETAEAAGMSRQEFAAYRGLLTESRTEAYDALLYRTMERLRREKTVAYKEERDRVRLQMAEEVGQRPEFVALDLIRGKGEEWLPLDREGVVERVGRDALEALPRGRPGKPTIRPGGASPDLVAERAGFGDGKALLEALLGIQRRHLELVAANDGRSVLEEAIDVATEAEMTERHADAFDDGSLEEEALELIHTDASADRLAAEVRQLARKSGDVPPPVDVVKRWAERIVREGRVQDHASAAALERHRRAESRAARAAEQAYMGGDFQTAFVEKQRQMFASALYRASRDAKNKVDVIARRLDRLARAKTLKGMDQDYLDQIHGLLEQYDLRKRSAADIRERESFDKWAKAREEEGIEVFIPERLTLAGNLNFTKLTFEDLSALDDAVQSLAHLGREKKRLKLAKEERDFAELIGEAQAQAAGLPMRPWTAERNPKPSKLREVDAMLTKIEFLADQLDGGNPNGVFNRVLVQQATICANEKEELVAKVVLPLAELYLNAPKAQQKRWAQRVEVPEFITINPETREVHATTFLRSELIAVALNIGNASNLEKMLVGETLALPELQRESYAWTEEKVMSVLERELTAEDWQFVEKVWRQIDMLWPDIARSEREITGIVPEKIEGRKVTTPFGDIMGGYYPVVFDPLRSQRAADNLDADAAKLLGQIGRSISTPKGHTITRTSAAMPITFSLERVLFNHINRVATRIAYGRFVRDALKFISEPKIRKIVDEHAGLEYYKHLKTWLQRQVNEAALDTNTMAALDRILRQFRVNAQLVWMGFRITTMVSQVAGWSNSVAQIGSKYMLKGMFETARNMGEIRTWVFEQSGEMASRAQAFDRDIRAFYQDAGKAGRREGKTLLDYFARADDALGLDKVRAAAFWGIGMIDVYLVAMPTWVGAYHKGVDEGMTVDEARAYADKAVRESQGAGRAKDLSPIQDAGEATRILTLAYSYFSVQYNKQRETIHAARAGDWRRASMNVFWIMMVAPVAAAFMTGDWPDEEDRDVDGWVTWAMRKMFFGLWAGIPIVRDIASKTERAVSGKFSGEIKAPVYEAFSQIERPIGEAIRVAKGEGPSERWLQNTITPLGYFLGLPTGQVGSTAQYAYDVGTGAQNPDSFGDVVEGTVRGPQDDQR